MTSVIEVDWPKKLFWFVHTFIRGTADIWLPIVKYVKCGAPATGKKWIRSGSYPILQHTVKKGHARNFSYLFILLLLKIQKVSNFLWNSS
jgi:hypothetical protein